MTPPPLFRGARVDVPSVSLGFDIEQLIILLVLKARTPSPSFFRGARVDVPSVSLVISNHPLDLEGKDTPPSLSSEEQEVFANITNCHSFNSQNPTQLTNPSSKNKR
ncbi:hypothetical protein L2E82_22555 [Cichorium intybus]|uniref:Uncharacterized protein n=1 Tax=Cichorium intybus TaxID=13427 RepID=A0ACB9DYF8_CICIN|nr:hypothetical protein L2E82_22555 [Cichorium intybus]